MCLVARQPIFSQKVYLVKWVWLLCSLYSVRRCIQLTGFGKCWPGVVWGKVVGPRRVLTMATYIGALAIVYRSTGDSI